MAFIDDFTLIANNSPKIVEPSYSASLSNEQLITRLGVDLSLEDILLSLRMRDGFDPKAITLAEVTTENEQWLLRLLYTNQINGELKNKLITKNVALEKSGLISPSGSLAVMPLALERDNKTGLVKEIDTVSRPAVYKTPELSNYNEMFKPKSKADEIEAAKQKLIQYNLQYKNGVITKTEFEAIVKEYMDAGLSLSESTINTEKSKSSKTLVIAAGLALAYALFG